MKPLISVIIPTYDEEKYLESTIRSIKNQCYDGKYEIIVSDGGSKDGTLKIAKKYRIKTVVNGRGISLGRNAGAEASKGGILLFIDADTIIMPNLLSEFERSFRNKNVVGVTCSIMPSKMDVTNLSHYLAYNSITNLGVKTIYPRVAGTCVAYRRNEFFEIGGFDEKINALEDLDISQRISKLGKIIFNENTLAVTSARRIERYGNFKFLGKLAKLYLKLLTKQKIEIKEYRPVR
ncbi:MAG: glycosyltransferase [Candidatus Aenigmatarchaeota archaeon]